MSWETAHLRLPIELLETIVELHRLIQVHAGTINQYQYPEDHEFLTDIEKLVDRVTVNGVEAVAKEMDY
ncbi:MAG: hypothetical protein WAZ19_07465 [Anaerolineae bacterium]